SGFKEPPAVDTEYYLAKRPLPFDSACKHEEFETLKVELAGTIGTGDPLGAIIYRNCCPYQSVLRVLAARGTPDVYKHSRDLYGSTKDRFEGDRTTVRELGLLLYEILSGIRGEALPDYPKVLSAEEVVDRLNERFARIFADARVHAKLDDGILSD